MRSPTIALMAVGALLSAGMSSVAAGQNAVRSLGGNVSKAIGGAARTVRSNGQTGTGQAAASARGQETSGEPLSSGDALARTDAQACSLRNGSTLRVSGGFQPSGQTTCSR